MILRKKVLSDLHSSHQGMDRTKRRARQTVFWPGLNRDIEHMISNCEKCRYFLASLPKEELIQIPKGELPFQSVSVDIFSSSGQEFLILVDQLSGWTCLSKMGRSTSTQDVIKAIRAWFADIEAPSILTSDGGPQFTSKQFRDFCRRWCITHEISSPH